MNNIFICLKRIKILLYPNILPNSDWPIDAIIGTKGANPPFCVCRLRALYLGRVFNVFLRFLYLCLIFICFTSVLSAFKLKYLVTLDILQDLYEVR